MASNINPTNIDTTYPIAGQDNDTQGFRTNFTVIYDNFITAGREITSLQSTVTNAPVITTVPISPTSAGIPGQVAYDNLGDYFYVCYATNAWAKFPSTIALAGAYVDATGTADALIANYNPAVTSLFDGLVLLLGAILPNATTSPTLKVNGFSPLPIYKGTNQPLLIGDIGGANHEMQLIYNAGTNSFTLLNPIYGVANAAIATGTFSTTYLDGVVIDYVSGNGRISVGTNDALTIYNNGVSGVQLAKFNSNGMALSGNLLFTGNSPTISSGFGTSASIESNNGSLTFRANIGLGGTATSGVIGLPLAAHGWNSDFTVFNPTLTNLQQTTICNASSNVSITLTNVWTANAVVVAWPASTVLMIQATAY